MELRKSIKTVKNVRKNTIEFGDFQTPEKLAEVCAKIVIARFPEARTIVEPNCGIGNFIQAALTVPSKIDEFYGWEINDKYVEEARRQTRIAGAKKKVVIEHRDFFAIDWDDINTSLRSPCLFIGNPPWVTSAVLGQLESINLPEKTNFQKHNGFDAITGKSNFDISEWMLIKIADYIHDKNSAMAFLIKTSVARKIFLHICNNNLSIDRMAIYSIDAKAHFNVSVDACLFYAEGTDIQPTEYRCPVFADLEQKHAKQTIGYKRGKIVADIETYKKIQHIDQGSEIAWRSGIKHDTSKIMELRREGRTLINGYGEAVDVPYDYLYPMYKSSNIAKETVVSPARFMLVTQQKIGQETAEIRKNSPKTWKYLLKYQQELDARRSTIYKKAPPYAIFGVGEYSFMPWKVAISGLYKNIKFQLIGSFEGRPIVLDDTCYSLGFERKEQAQFVLELLTSNAGKEFIESIVFHDNKRPVTVAVLNRISLKELAKENDCKAEYEELFELSNVGEKDSNQLPLAVGG